LVLLDLKNEITGKAMNKNLMQVSYYLRKQPENKYYKIVLEHIKNRIKNEARIV